MAKKSSIEKNNRRKRMAKNAAPKRARLKAIIADKDLPMEERFAATLKLAEMPRNSSTTRIRNRCEITGRSALELPQEQAQPYRAARARIEGPGSRPREVELVRRVGTMSTHDPISDLITRIRNAQMRSKSKVSTPARRCAPTCSKC